MSVKNIILASVLAIVVLAAGSVIGCYFHYNNQEISLRQQSEAQRGKIEGVHDKMWKVLQQKAQVTDEYKSSSSPSIRSSLRADTQRETARL